jgi:hypothetical protein
MNPKPLLDLIARHESESSVARQGVDSSYDVVVNQAFKVYPPERPITTMTVEEVLRWQNEAIRRYKQRFISAQGYSAAGRYQIIRSTLLDLIDSHWKLKDLFDAGTQDLLGALLLEKRGFKVWTAGKMSDSKFADSLSQEWASLPFNTGYSYYAGDRHGNKALVSREEMMDTLRDIKGEVN